MADTERLLNVDAVARGLNCSPRGVWRMRDSGRMPAPVQIGKLVRWRATELGAWIAAGCPDVRRTGWTAAAQMRSASAAGDSSASRKGQ